MSKNTMESILAEFENYQWENHCEQNLLGTNTKTEKQNGIEYLMRGLSLAPAHYSGFDVCPAKTKACLAACVLWMTGRTVMPTTRRAMIRRTLFMKRNPEGFRDNLRRDIKRLLRKAENENLKPVVRLNVASDARWNWVFREFPKLTGYDYTKVIPRMNDKTRPDNYHLTYSYSENTPKGFVDQVISTGQNVAVVFDTLYQPQQNLIGELPKSATIEGKRYRVVDGDKIDFRLPEIDGRGVIVGLRFKGSKARKIAAIKSGFCYETKK